MARLDELCKLPGHQGIVWNVGWNQEGNILVSCGEDKTIRLWGRNVNSDWVCRSILSDGHQRTIRSVSFSPCNKLIASASFDGTCCIWDKSTSAEGNHYECTATLEGHENEVKCVAWSASGSFLSTCSRDKSVWIWEVGEDGEFECAAVLNAHSQDVKKVIWHPNQDILASASYDNTVKMYCEEDDDWVCFGTLKSHESTVWSLAFDSTGKLLATCSDDRTVKIWKEYLPGNEFGVATSDNKPTWKCVCTLSGDHPRAIYDISWCHQTGLIATASGDDAIRIFRIDPENDPNAPILEQLITVPRAHEQDVNSVIWNPCIPGLLASCSDDMHVKLWQFKG
jgi:WD40 repeat protein